MMYIRLAILALILGLGLSCWALWNRSQLAVERQHAAEAQLERAVAVNRVNAKAMRELQIDIQIERDITAEEIKQAADRLTASNKLIKEMRNVPGANDPAGAFWDEYSRRLRASNGNRTPNH